MILHIKDNIMDKKLLILILILMISFQETVGLGPRFLTPLGHTSNMIAHIINGTLSPDHQLLWNLEAERDRFRVVQLISQLTGVSAAGYWGACQILDTKIISILWFPNLARSYDKTLYHFVNEDLDVTLAVGVHAGSRCTLEWRHNGRDCVSNHQPHDCFLNRLFRHRSKKTSKLRVTGLCAGNSPEAGEFPTQRASNAENVSIWWRHHDLNHWCGVIHFKRQYKNNRTLLCVWKKPECGVNTYMHRDLCKESI